METQPTFFEGPEKKVEVVVGDSMQSLRSLGDDFWNRIVKACGAQVLSVLRNDECDAYLLSESSLFVYERAFTMITCGRTQLATAVLEVVEAIGRESIELLIYERKNENFPNRQPTSFYDDARRLAEVIPGHAIRFGDEHDHHVQMFCSNASFEVDANDTTLEILMHGLPEHTAGHFIGESTDSRTIAERCGLGPLLEGFEIDEHPFTPAGYSMNALRGGDYVTVHVTPESIGSYVSFETNLDFRADLPRWVAGVAAVFEPSSLDVIAFAPEGTLEAAMDPKGYVIKDHVRTVLNGYDVTFWHCYRPHQGPRTPVSVPLF